MNRPVGFCPWFPLALTVQLACATARVQTESSGGQPTPGAKASVSDLEAHVAVMNSKEFGI